VSDDTHPHTLVTEGHMDHILRRAVAEGIDPITALQMVTINTATCFRMDHEMGSVTPGKCADLVLLRDLDGFEATRVFIDGVEVARDGRLTAEPTPFAYPVWVTHSMHVRDAITPQTFTLAAPEGASAVELRVIEVIPSRVGNYERHLTFEVKDGTLQSDLAQDALKTFVFERHHKTGSVGAGFVKGFGITSGALASTVAHDAHNLLVMGSNDADMALAANTLIAGGGGMVAVRDGEVLGHVSLPIAGLMDNRSAEEMAASVAALQQAWVKMGCTLESPFMTLALVPLACLPELRLTNRGLVDCTTFCLVDLMV
ncbi:MAG: amidohydrolase family protein, partial [Coriobacteriales bacterium]|nr:amidohydrolase family protein [Coriobacteriales bacterium]